MRRNQAGTWTRRFALALAAIAGAAPAATAAAIAYTTTGGLGTTTYDGAPGQIVRGTAGVTFSGVTGGSFNTDGTNVLGSLVVTPIPAGAGGVYNNVPFNIQFTAPDLHKVVSNTVTPTDGSAPYQALTQYDAVFTLFGHLTGAVQTDGQSDLTYTVDGFRPVTSALMTTDRSYLSDLPFPVSDLTAGPTFHLTTPAGGGSLAITVQAVPEPSTLALACTVAAGLALRHRARRRA